MMHGANYRAIVTGATTRQEPVTLIGGRCGSVTTV